MKLIYKPFLSAPTLREALRLKGNECVSFTGAGGKTTAILQLARDFDKVIITTTTHLGAWQTQTVNKHLIVNSAEDLIAQASEIKDGITLITAPLIKDKYGRLGMESLLWLRAFCQSNSLPLLIEADGSRQKPLKAPAEHEPPIPNFSDSVIVCAGLSGLGKPLGAETIHRGEEFSALSALSFGEIITSDSLADVLQHPNGGLKNIPPQARKIALLNQSNTQEAQSQAGKTASLLLSSFESVVVTGRDSENADLKIISRHDKTAAIILAAGGAKRYGQPKQLLDFHGKPFVRAVAETALKAGLQPVIVVCGAYSEDVTAALADLPVSLIYNSDWQSGQASSIKAGISALPAESGAALFLLADQPQVSPQVITALLERHAQTLESVLAPFVFGQRANPVLFDRITFEALLALQGDTGGRGIFSLFSPRYLNWYDRTLLLDVDTPEDYQKLIESTSPSWV